MKAVALYVTNNPLIHKYIAQFICIPCFFLFLDFVIVHFDRLKQEWCHGTIHGKYIISAMYLYIGGGMEVPSKCDNYTFSAYNDKRTILLTCFLLNGPNSRFVLKLIQKHIKMGKYQINMTYWYLLHISL